MCNCYSGAVCGGAGDGIFVLGSLMYFDGFGGGDAMSAS